MLSRLKPDTATVTGLAQAGVVYGIYTGTLPNLADIRSSAPHDETIEQTRKHAAYMSTAVVLGTFFFTRDVQAFIIGGAALVGIDYMTKHANAVHPSTNKVDSTSNALSIAPGMAEAEQPLPSYSDGYSTDAYAVPV